jgi:hypothetical protein
LTVSTDSGDPNDIIEHMTAWVRDSGGAEKLYPSKVRVRSYAGGTLTVAENNIDWANGDVITVKRLWEIWPRIPWVDPADGTQYKDRDVAWASDADSQLPKANGGVAAIGQISGGNCDLVFTDNGSFACPGGGAVSSWLWADIGGAPTVQAGAEASSTVTYRYTTAGYYYVSLTVTDANGKTGVHYIPVIVVPATDTYAVSDNWPGDRYYDQRGWVLSRSLEGIDSDESVWFDGAPVFLVGDSQGTASGAFVNNRSNLRWSGWLIEDQTERSFFDRRITYRAVSSAHILDTVPAFGTRFTSDAAPAVALDGDVCLRLPASGRMDEPTAPRRKLRGGPQRSRPDQRRVERAH